MAKHILVKPIGVVAGIAAVVFLFMPPHTFAEVLLFFGSLTIALICAVVSGSLNNENTGYWPNKPKQ
jgi:hypothetical protein